MQVMWTWALRAMGKEGASVKHENMTDIYAWMRGHAPLLGERIVEQYPALHRIDDPLSPRIQNLLRIPFPAQSVAIMGVAKR
jgi:hypothetical protein